tara:strand:- start:100469 stop:101158 length:690 start_codon:yes stop_codon:yes gene_type:complete
LSSDLTNIQQSERLATREKTAPKSRPKKKSNFWKKQARIWHWISGAVCLVGMLLFSFTGITLNHAADIPATPETVSEMMTLEGPGFDALLSQPEDGTTPSLPRETIRALRSGIGVNTAGREAEWTDFDVYVALPRPGGDAWLAIDRETGEVEYERTTRGVISWLNDLHKGRNTGSVWFWFIDIFSVAAILFCLTGLWLLQIHAGKRAITWPLTIAGLVVPAALAIFFIH